VHDHKTPQVLEAQELSAPCCYAQIPDTHTFSFSLATKRLMIMLCQALACSPTAIRNKQFEHAHRESQG